jgi:hypothetical protein
MTKSATPPILAGKHYDEPSAFVPENLLREARRQKGLKDGTVPSVCVLDPDGDIVRQTSWLFVQTSPKPRIGLCRPPWKIAGQFRMAFDRLVLGCLAPPNLPQTDSSEGAILGSATPTRAPCRASRLWRAERRAEQSRDHLFATGRASPRPAVRR